MRSTDGQANENAGGSGGIPRLLHNHNRNLSPNPLLYPLLHYSLFQFFSISAFSLCSSPILSKTSGATFPSAFLAANRESTALIRSWPHDGTYQAFLQSDLLLEVRAVLKRHERL